MCRDGTYLEGGCETELETFFYVANYFVRPLHFSIKYANEQRWGDHDVIFRQSARCPVMSCSGSRGNFGPIKASAHLGRETAWALLSYKLIQVITEGGREYKVIFKFAPI